MDFAFFPAITQEGEDPAWVGERKCLGIPAAFTGCVHINRIDSADE
jgi:hypothetical protein